MNPTERSRAWGGIFIKRERWSLSFSGSLFLLCFAASLVVILARGLYPFLAITDRVASRVLVVDGWLPSYELNQAVAEFSEGQYGTVLAVRAVYGYETATEPELRSDYVSNILLQKGIPRERLHAVLFEGLERDRTLSSALAVSEWMRQHNQPIQNLNLVTEATHARRSRLLYERALGAGIPIGVVALRDPSYDPRHWWRSSEGVRSVLFEAFAYVFVRCHFLRTDSPSVRLIPVVQARLTPDLSLPHSVS